MSSIILYKFRAQTNFEQISLPGSSARLFDIKRAIVVAKRLDKTGGMQIEFDLSVRNAMTEEEYTDENALIPRGTRVIVQRLPAAKGQGILARIARADGGMGSGVTARYGNQDAANGGFYTIESHKDDDEFVRTTSAPTQTSVEADSDELAALKAVTEQTTGSVYTASSHSRTSQSSKAVPAAGMAPPPKPQLAHFHQQNVAMARPNADPELREQERLAALAGQPKKRATGIPRTFLSVSAPTVESEEGHDEESGSTMKLQPNPIAFEALINRGGGQSGTGSKALDLDYALKLTATEIPEHLQCGICAQVVKNAMLIPWDPEGRTACEMCMRDGLAKNAFRCPLTGNEGVSPDDLLPNVGLRKAVDAFVKTVFEKMNEIVLAQEAEDEAERVKMAKESEKTMKTNDFEADTLDKGVVLSRKNAGSSVPKRVRNDDFGDDFGGDVFDVEPEFEDEDNVEEDSEGHNVAEENSNLLDTESTKISGNDMMIMSPAEEVKAKVDTKGKEEDGNENEKPEIAVHPDKNQETESEKVVNDVSSVLSDVVPSSSVSSSQQAVQLNLSDVTKNDSTDKSESPHKSRRELLKNRAPPQGYTMGPAGINDPHLTGGRGYLEGRRHTGFQGGSGRYPSGGRFNEGRGFNTDRGNGQYSREGRGGYSVSQDDQSLENPSHQSRSDGEAHYAKRFRADDGGRGGGRGERACFNCGGTGHLARDCPQPKHGGRGFDHGGRGAPGRGADWHRGGRFDSGGRGRDMYGRGGRGSGRWGGDGRGRF